MNLSLQVSNNKVGTRGSACSEAIARRWELALVLGMEGFAYTLLFWQFQSLKEILLST